MSQSDNSCRNSDVQGVMDNRSSSNQHQEYIAACENSITENNQTVPGQYDQSQDAATRTKDVTIEKVDLNKAPDGGWGWLIVLGAFLVHVLTGGFERSSGTMYLQLLEKFNKSATETSWVLAIFPAMRLCMCPVASAMCNQFSIRLVVTLGAIMSTVGVLITAFTPNLRFMYFSYGLLTGCGRAFTYCPCLIIVGYYFNKRRGLAVGLATSGAGIGSFLFPPMIENMFEYYGFQGTYLILTGFVFNYAISGALFRPLELHRQIMKNDRKKQNSNKIVVVCDSNGTHLPETTILEVNNENVPPRKQNVENSFSPMAITASANMARKSSVSNHKSLQFKLSSKKDDSVKKTRKPLLEWSLFKNYAFSVLCVQLFLFTLSFHATYVFMPALAEERVLTKVDGAYLVSILGISDAAARVTMSIVLDLKQVKQYRLLIYNFLMVLLGIVSIVIPSMNHFWQLMVVCAIYGILSGTYISQKSVLVVDILGVEKLSSSFGFLQIFQGLGSLIGPVVGGLFKDFQGSYDMSFYFGSIGIFLGALTLATGNVWLYLQRRKEIKLEQNTRTHDS